MPARRPLEGMSALVTGGGGGIGRRIAFRLAADGAAVTIFGRTLATLESAAELINAELGSEGAITCVAGDARQEGDLAAGVVEAGREYPLKICVTTAGAGIVRPILALAADQFRAQLDDNLVTAFNSIKHSAAAMVEAGGGSIVCITSTAAKLPFTFQSAYCSAKAGLEALVRVAAEEFGPLNVRVNAIRPGVIKTERPAIRRLLENQSVLEAILREKPLGRTGTTDDVAAGVRYLAGPESSWVTGQSFAIDGGNELRRAPDLEMVARMALGDELIDRSRAGRLTPVDGASW